MPSLAMKGNKLNHCTQAINKQMGRHLKVYKAFKEWMSGAIESVTKQLFYAVSAKFSGRQTDVVNYQQINVGAWRPVTLIRGWNILHIREQMVFDVELHT